MDLAKRGAEHRLAELQAEIAALIKTFPHLSTSRGRRGKPQIDASAEPAAMIDWKPRKRRRRVTTSAQRKAVSLKMKKWAARKAKKS